MKKPHKGHSLLTWDDVYFDGLLDPFEEDFCEDTQEIVRLRKSRVDKLDWDKCEYEWLDEDEE